MEALLTNTSRRPKTYHLATRTHEVLRRIPTETVSGEIGIREERRMVPSSITFQPKERKRVGSDVLDSPEVQAAIDAKVLKMVELETAPTRERTAPPVKAPSRNAKKGKHKKTSTRKRGSKA